MTPGHRLRTIAAWLCSQRTMERLIDPIVADLQAEYGDEVRQGRVWRSRWIRVAACLVLAQSRQCVRVSTRNRRHQRLV